jgi:hypothetical protein
MLGGDLHPASAELGETKTIALKTLPGHIPSHWGSSAWPKDPDPTKLPRCVVNRSVIGFLLLGVWLVSAGEGRLSTSIPKISDNDRQPEIAVVLTFRDKLCALRRLGNFLAEVPDKVFDGVIDVQRRHGPQASKVAAPAATLNLRLLNTAPNDFSIMQSVFSAASRRTIFPERFRREGADSDDVGRALIGIGGHRDAYAFPDPLPDGVRGGPPPLLWRSGEFGRASRLRYLAEDAVIAMLQRPEGATVDEVASAMGWQRHMTKNRYDAGPRAIPRSTRRQSRPHSLRLAARGRE